MKNIFIYLSVLFIFCSNLKAQDANLKLARTAKSMIGKKDKKSLKLNTLEAWDAVRYCAKKAKIINQKKSNKLKSTSIIHINDPKVISITKIPKGNIIGFFNNNILIHAMISTGNGKAIGINSKKAIGIGSNGKWEEITLQQLRFRTGYGEFRFNNKLIKVKYKSAANLNQKNTNNSVVDNESNSDDSRTDHINTVMNTKWSKVHEALFPDHAFQKHQSQFPEFKNWKQYASKANSLLATYKTRSRSVKSINPNLVVKKYRFKYLYDTKDKILVKLDNKNLPMEMFKLKNEDQFNDFIKWARVKGTKDKIDNAKKEFKRTRKEFKFKTWDEYAYEAQRIVALHNPEFPNVNLFHKRVFEQFLYFNNKSKVLVVTNLKKEVVTMFKPKEGLDYYIDLEDPNYPDPQTEALKVRNKKEVKTKEREYEAVSDLLDGSEEEYDEVENEQENTANTVDPANEYGVVDLTDYSEYTNEMPKKKPIDWAKSGNTSAARAASLAYNKYKKEFFRPKKVGNGIIRITLVQYISIAHYFNMNTPEDSLTKVLSNGNVAKYHHHSNLLGVYTSDGLPVLLSKPANREAAFNDLN